jgi:hypothetical protein
MHCASWTVCRDWEARHLLLPEPHHVPVLEERHVLIPWPPNGVQESPYLDWTVDDGAEGAAVYEEVGPTQFSRADFESAFRYLQTGRHMGKVVINWEEEAEIPVIPSHDPEYFFDSQATYVIAGGLGGISRSLARWFTTRGARHLISLSRSGAVSEKAITLVPELT